LPPFRQPGVAGPAADTALEDSIRGYLTMSKVCQVTGKRPVTGNNVSHSHRKTRRRFLPNLHYHRFWVESESRFVRLRVSAAGMRIIDKKGIDAVLADLRSRGEKV
jgi:large subunit ribosomal protein L28